MHDETEEWRPVVGADRYEVSNLGRVRSWIIPRSDRRPEVPNILKPSPNTDGYLILQIFVNGKGSCRQIHNLVLESFVGPRPGPFPPWEGAHDDGDKTNNRVANLKWVTKHQNADDKRRHGTSTPLRPVEVRDGVKHFRCTKCDTWKPEGEFGPLSPAARKASLCGLRSSCRECGRANDRERARARRAAAKAA